MGSRTSGRGFVGRAVIVIGVSTFVLTSAFLGVLSLMTGGVIEVGTRLPFYLVVAGAVFVGTVVLLEEHGAEAEVILMTAVVTGVLALAAVSLGVEGVVFAVNNPERVFVSQLVLYFIAAALIGTGLAYWGINHWREFTDRRTGGGL